MKNVTSVFLILLSITFVSQNETQAAPSCPAVFQSVELRKISLRFRGLSADPNWKQYEHDVHKVMEANANSHFEKIEKAIKENQLYAVFLQKAGMRIKDGRVIMPKLSQIVDYYYFRINEAISRGEITVDDVIEPGLLFEDPSGKVMVVKLGEKFPENMKPSDFASNEDFAKMLGNGIFPLSAFDAQTVIDNWGGVSHDIGGHFAGFAEYPAEYMKPFKRTMAKFSSGIGDSKLEDIENRLHQKLFFVQENIFFVPKSKLNLVKSALLVPPNYFDQAFFNIETMKQYLSNFSLKEIHDRIKYISDNFHNFIATPGGIATDVVSRQRWTEKFYYKEKQFDDLFIYKMESNFKAVSNGSAEKWGMSEEVVRNIMISELAKIQTLLALGIRYDANAWMKAIFDVRYDDKNGYVASQSQLIKEITNSGLFQNDGYMLFRILFVNP